MDCTSPMAHEDRSHEDMHTLSRMAEIMRDGKRVQHLHDRMGAMNDIAGRKQERQSSVGRKHARKTKRSVRRY